MAPTSWTTERFRLPRRVGFRIEERMEGRHRLLRDLPAANPPRRRGDELPFVFVAKWGHPRLSGFINPLGGDYLSAALAGEVWAGGVCEAASLVGSLEFNYVSKQSIQYRFDFDASAAEAGDGAGRRLRFRGEKRHIRLWNLPWSHTTCYGELTELASGDPISTVLLRFPFRTLIPFLSSFRLTY